MLKKDNNLCYTVRDNNIIPGAYQEAKSWDSFLQIRLFLYNLHLYLKPKTNKTQVLLFYLNYKNGRF